jgi:acyl-CoA thioesterase
MQDRLAKLQEAFLKDPFVSESIGASITDAADGYAKCSMTIEPKHCNSFGIPMGGVLFTLADFAFAVAANQDGKTVVTQAAQITFLTPAKGSSLTAEARAIREGAQTSFFSVMITDDLGTEVAFATANGYRIHAEREKDET